MSRFTAVWERYCTQHSTKMKFVVCMLLFAILQWENTDAEYCEAMPNFITPGAPRLPSLPSQFQTRVEAIIVDQNYTCSAEEYYDGPNNRAALNLMTRGTLFKLIYDYKNNQLFYVHPKFCMVNKITTDNNGNLFGNNIDKTGMPHVYTANGVLHFAKKFGEVYKGQTTVRGISVNHWQSCMYWANMKSNFTLDYYFSVPGWSMSGDFPQAPIRAEVRGVRIQDDGSVRNFHHIYDYIDFRTHIYADASIFQTPSGVLCPGRLETRDVPRISEAFMYREEIVATTNKMVQTADVWYHGNYKLIRYDFRSPAYTGPYFKADRATEIHDYNTGTAYAIDKTIGNCTIIPISNTSFDAASVQSGGDGIKSPQILPRLKSPQEIFNLDSNYSYEGQRMSARGIMCDVFIGQRYSSIFLQNTTMEYYFLADTWLESNNIGDINLNTQAVPIQLDIMVPSISFKATYNIYDFAPEFPEITDFDISPCFAEEDMINFKLVYHGSFDAVALKYKKAFLLKTIQIVAEAAGVSPIRIANPVIKMKSNVAYFVANLVERPPYFGNFLSKQNDQPNLKTAWDNLKFAVSKQLVKISIKYSLGETVIYTASEIRDDDMCSKEPSKENNSNYIFG